MRTWGKSHSKATTSAGDTRCQAGSGYFQVTPRWWGGGTAGTPNPQMEELRHKNWENYPGAPSPPVTQNIPWTKLHQSLTSGWKLY